MTGAQYFDADMLRRRQIADIGIAAFLKMLFVDNFVHGDLHPGNILVRFEDGLLFFGDISTNINRVIRKSNSRCS